MPEEQTTLPGPRVSRITIGRLHNLGNYEHVRYEISVDVPPGNAPSAVLHELEKVLADLKPRSPVTAFDVQNARKGLADPDSAHNHDYYRRQIARHEEWQQTRDAALKRFEQLGGSSVFTDAKERWDDDDLNG